MLTNLSCIVLFVSTFCIEGNLDDLNTDKFGHTKDSIEKVQKLVKEKKAIVLDVRSESEWDAGHLKIANFFSVSKIQKLTDEDKKDLKKIAKGKVVYTYCKAGFRALRCKKILSKLGYDCRSLKMGYEELVENGMEPAEKEKSK